ncbi:MAG: hypothetical protein ACU85V_03355 [Gammaproteobacteria bacterium]
MPLPLRLFWTLTAALIAACGADRSYYPLDAGRWWYFEVEQTILDETRESRYLLVNAGPATLAGEPAVAQVAQSASVDFLRKEGRGVHRVARRRPDRRAIESEPEAHVILPASLAPGTRWQVTSTLGLAESRTFARGDRIAVRRYPVTLEKAIVAVDASVTAPAGVFDGCLEVEGRGQRTVPADRGTAAALVTVRTREWYAPGIGLVLLERSEDSKSPFLKPGRQRWALADYGR